MKFYYSFVLSFSIVLSSFFVNIAPVWYFWFFFPCFCKYSFVLAFLAIISWFL